MNKKMVFYIIGMILLFVSALMLLPAAVALIYKEYNALKAFLITIAVLAAFGFGLTKIKVAKKTIFSREGLVAVSLGWVIMSVGGALPFIISGEIPNFIDAMFETVSGFTTTGASILSDVEALSYSMIFWRSFTHWIGGMGVLVFVIAAIPLAGGGGNIHLLRAESPGMEVSKLVPTSRGTAFRLYSIYFVMTVAEVILLLIEGNPLFDSLTLSFGTAGTGGFAIKNTSLANYSPATQVTITVFMSAFGINFSCYYLLLTKKVGEFFRNEELRTYLAIQLGTIALITVNIAHMFNNVGDALRAAAFQASSVMTTTGYTTVDYNLWPETSRMLLIILMCIGACEGSTGGGIKVSRIIILFREAMRRLRAMITPGKVESVRYGGKAVSESTVTAVTSFFILYMIIFVVSVLLLSFDTADTVSNISGVIATLNNIGPGLEIVGATGNYGGYSAFSKIVFTFDMLAGRLELIPMLALFSKRTWQK